MSNTTTPATSDDALRAENEALKAQLAQIESIVSDFRGGTTYDKVATMHRTALIHSDAYSRYIIAMQACLIDCENAYKRESISDDYELPGYMDWLVNTLAGPGFLPDIDEANELGGAQAFADKAHAELGAHRKLYPLPEVKEIEDLRAELARWADPHQHWFVQQRDGTVYLPLGTGTCSDMVAPKEGWVIEAPVLELLTSLDSHIRQQDQAVDKMLDEAAKVGAATQDAPLETSEADARELPPEVAAKFMTPQ